MTIVWKVLFITLFIIGWLSAKNRGKICRTPSHNRDSDYIGWTGYWYYMKENDNEGENNYGNE